MVHACSLRLPSIGGHPAEVPCCRRQPCAWLPPGSRKGAALCYRLLAAPGAAQVATAMPPKGRCCQRLNTAPLLGRPEGQAWAHRLGLRQLLGCPHAITTAAVSCPALPRSAAPSLSLPSCSRRPQLLFFLRPPVLRIFDRSRRAAAPGRAACGCPSVAFYLRARAAF